MGEYTYDDDGMPVLRDETAHNMYNQFGEEPDIRDIFDMKGDGYDVVLSLASGTISWASVSSGRGECLD
jgi:hypothetical protein